MTHNRLVAARPLSRIFSTTGNFCGAGGRTDAWTNGAARRAATSSARTSRLRIKSFIAVVSLIIGFAGFVAETPARGAEADVHAALQRWVETLGSGKGEAPIAALYAPEAILLSTFDPRPLETPTEIAAYFHKLTRNPNLKATAQTEKIHPFADGGADSGLYTFSGPRVQRGRGGS